MQFSKSIISAVALLCCQQVYASRFNVVCTVEDKPAASGASPAPAAPASNPPAASGSAPAASTNTTTSSTGSAPSTGSGDAKITYDQFCKAAEAYSASGNGTPPKPSQAVYDEFLKNVCTKMELYEAAMMLANCVWETGGLQFVEEIACKTGTCGYGKYYGRGYIQLTWDYNYKEASKDIYGDESKYLNSPELVAQPADAWKTAVWFWTKRVQPVLKQNDAVKKGLFGYTVKVINGGLECPANDKAQKRLKIFNEIRKAWNLSGPEGVMTGC